jgi:hypothetical protein
MYGKLAAGLLTLGIAMSTTVSAQAHGAALHCTDGVKTATSFQGGCDLGSRPRARPHRRGGIPAGGPSAMTYTLSDSMVSS